MLAGGEDVIGVVGCVGDGLFEIPGEGGCCRGGKGGGVMFRCPMELSVGDK